MAQRPFSQASLHLYLVKARMYSNLDLNKFYLINIIEWGKENRKTLELLEKQRQWLFEQQAAGNMNKMGWEIYDRQMRDNKQVEYYKKNSEKDLKSQIELETATLFGRWHDIEGDFKSDYDDKITETEFIEFLSGYKKLMALLAANGLHSFNKAPLSLTEAIDKYLTVTT